MQRGDIVRFSEPEPGEEGFRFVVLEAHEDAIPPRVHIRLICDLPIGPVETVAPSDVEEV